MKVFFKVKDGQFVGFDKFQDGNYAAVIDHINVSKSLIPKVRKINYDIGLYRKELEGVKKLLDEKFAYISKYPFTSKGVMEQIYLIGSRHKIPLSIFDELIIKLNAFGINSIDEIFRHTSFPIWKKGIPPQNPKPDLIEFFHLMSLIIKYFKRYNP